MFRSWNRKFVVVLVGVIVFLWAGAVGGEEAEYVTLAEAQRLARENSYAVKLAELDLEEAQLQLEQAEAAQIMQPSPTNLMQARTAYELARRGFTMAQDDLALTVKTDFYTVLQMENMLETAEEALRSAERQLDITQRRYEAGTVTNYDVIQASGGVLSSSANVLQAKHGLDLSLMNLQQTLGLPIDAGVRPAAEAFEVEKKEIDLEDDLAFALENREEIRQLQAAVAVAEKSVELADNDYTPALELRMAKLQREKAMMQLADIKRLLTLEMHQSYTTIRDAEERIPVLEKEVEEAEELQRLSELMYESDMITSSDLQDAQLAVLSARNELVTAITDFNIAQASYFYTVARALRDEQ